MRFPRMKKYQANSYRENEVHFTDTDLSFGTDLESNILTIVASHLRIKPQRTYLRYKMNNPIEPEIGTGSRKTWNDLYCVGRNGIY